MSYKSTKPVVTYPLNDVVAAACIAYHTNGNMIEKYDVPAYEGSSDGPILPAKAVKSNKTIAMRAINDPSTITQEARDEAEEVIRHIQGMNTMALLTGKSISNFSKDIAEAMELIEVPSFKIGLLVYAPSLHFNAVRREEITEITAELSYTSMPLGEVGDKITVNFTLIEKRLVESFDMFSAYGKDDKGNLIQFLTKHEKLAASGVYTAKVKATGQDKWHNNAMVTQLNYVKGV